MRNLFSEEPPPTWLALVKFVWHVLIGAVAFGTIALAAGGLSLLVTWLGHLGVNPTTLRILQIVEHGIVIGDGVLFALFFAVEAWRFLKEIRP